MISKNSIERHSYSPIHQSHLLSSSKGRFEFKYSTVTTSALEGSFLLYILLSMCQRLHAELPAAAREPRDLSRKNVTAATTVVLPLLLTIDKQQRENKNKRRLTRITQSPYTRRSATRGAIRSYVNGARRT